MITFEQAGDILDEAAEALPEGLFDHLNGGVNLLPRAEHDEDGFVILGRYFRNTMGRYVEIYYGSFAELYPDIPPESLRKKLTKTLHHELTHHIEDLAGDRSLEKQDILDKEAMLAGFAVDDDDDDWPDEPVKRPPAVCEITDATAEQVPEIAEIERDCFSDPWPEKTLKKNLTDGKSRVCLAAFEGGELLGYILMMYVLDEGDVSNVAVAYDERRRGVGAQLVTAICERAVSLGLKTLGLEVRESNTEARELYKKAGFEDVGRRKNYYRFPKEDAILMTKIL